MKNESQLQWMLETFDILTLEDALTDMGHDIDVFETKSDFVGYLKCLADGTCGAEGSASWSELRALLISDLDDNAEMRRLEDEENENDN